MIRKMSIGLSIVLAGVSCASAQPLPRAEKYSPRPVQSPTAPLDGGSHVYSRWTKLCGSERTAPAGQICLVGIEARRRDGPFAASAALIEGEGKILFRVMLPPGVSRDADVRVAIDGGAPRSGRFVRCLGGGCLADIEVGTSFATLLRSGQIIDLRARGAAGEPIAVLLPLDGFAAALDGPPSYPRMVEERWPPR